MKTVSRQEFEAKRLERELFKHLKLSLMYDENYITQTILVLENKLKKDWSKDEDKYDDLVKMHIGLKARLKGLQER